MDPVQTAQLKDLGVPDADLKEMAAVGFDFTKWIVFITKAGPLLQQLIDAFREALNPGGVTTIFQGRLATPEQVAKVQKMGLSADAARIDFANLWSIIKMVAALLGYPIPFGQVAPAAPSK